MENTTRGPSSRFDRFVRIIGTFRKYISHVFQPKFARLPLTLTCRYQDNVGSDLIDQNSVWVSITRNPLSCLNFRCMIYFDPEGVGKVTHWKPFINLKV